MPKIFIMRTFLPLFFIVMCCLKSIAQTYIEPVFDRTDVPSLHINKIEVTKDTTFVHCTYTAEAGSWARISKDTYLYDHDKRKKYTILRCSGLPFSPQQRDFRFGESVQIVFCFPSIGTATKLDFIEDPNEEAFNIYGINLKERNVESFKETDYAHFQNMASLYGDMSNDTLKAIEYKKKEVEAAGYIYGIKSMVYSNSLLGACLLYDKYGFYKEAISGMNNLKDIHFKVWGEEDKYNYAMCVRTLAQFYSHASDHEMSIKTYKESIDALESLHVIDNEYALALRFFASEYNDIGDNESSLYYQQKAIDARRSIGDSDKYINELYDVALTTPINEELVESRIHIVEKELGSLPDFVDKRSEVFVDIYENIAFSYTLLEDNKTAINYCDKALALLKEKGEDNNEKYAEMLGLKCRYQRYTNLIHEAISTGEESKRLFETLHIRSIKYAELLGDLAGVYSYIDDYEQAVQLQEVACSIYEEVQDWLSLAEELNSIGDCYQNKYDYDKAEMYILKGLNILSNNVTAEQYVTYVINESQRQRTLSVYQDRVQRAICEYHSKLANLYLKKGEKKKAVEEEQKAVKILQVMPDDQDLYHIHLDMLASCYRENDQFDEAIKCGKQCLKFWENMGKKEDATASQYNLSLTYFTKGDTIRAIECAKNGVLISRSNENKLLTEGLGNLAILYWKSSKYKEAEKYLSEALDYIQAMLQSKMMEMTSEQKQRIWNHYRNLFILYRDLIYKNGGKGDDVAKLYDYVLFSKSLLLDSDVFEGEDLLTWIEVTWKDVQQKLADDGIAIEFLATQEEVTENITYYVYHALVIDKNCQYPQMITLLHEKEIGMKQETIGDLIWGPILTKYKNAKNIYFSPDGVWNVLPIENLLMTDSPFLLEDYNIYRLSSTKELVKPHKKSKIESAVLYGGLTYSTGEFHDLARADKEWVDFLRGIKERGGFDPLYKTQMEINYIEDLFKTKKIITKIYSGEDGTEESFKQLSGKKVSLIHLATHGMFVDMGDVSQKRSENNFVFLESFMHEKDPVIEDVLLTHSFLVMSRGNKLVQREEVLDSLNDGILTAKEIAKQNLSGLDLVVLSACETGMGQISMDGNYGLPRGFKKAGANTILMSLNKVDDEATTILMIEFYKNLMNGESKLQSLKNAQKFLREFDNGRYLDPKYWQYFIMLDGLD